MQKWYMYYAEIDIWIRPTSTTKGSHISSDYNYNILINYINI